MNEVVSGRDRVVSVRFDALHCVVGVETVLILHHFEDGLVKRHLFFAREKSADPFFFGKFEPGVGTDVVDGVAGVRVGV